MLTFDDVMKNTADIQVRLNNVYQFFISLNSFCETHKTVNTRDIYGMLREISQRGVR